MNVVPVNSKDLHQSSDSIPISSVLSSKTIVGRSVFATPSNRPGNKKTQEASSSVLSSNSAKKSGNPKQKTPAKISSNPPKRSSKLKQKTEKVSIRTLPSNHQTFPDRIGQTNPRGKARSRPSLQGDRVGAVRSPTNSPNLNQLFYQFIIVDGNETELFFVPASQLPAKLKDHFLKTCTSEDIELGKMDPKKRIQTCREKLRIPVYQVKSVKPLKIDGMDSRVFIRKHGCTLEQALFNILDRETQQQIVTTQTETPGITAAYSPKTFFTCSGEPTPGGSTSRELAYQQQIFMIFELFQSQQCQLINQFGKQISLWEPNQLIGDMLSQRVINQRPMDEKLKKILSQCLLKHWQEMLWFLNHGMICCMYSEAKNDAKSKEMFLNAIDQLKSLPKTLETILKGEMKDLLDDLQRIQAPLILLIQSAMNFQSDETLHIFCEKLQTYLNDNIRKFFDITIYVNHTKRSIKDVLEFRAKILNHCIQSMGSSCKKLQILSPLIVETLKQQNWLVAYQAMFQLAEAIKVIQKEIMEASDEDNALTDGISVGSDKNIVMFDHTRENMGYVQSVLYLSALVNDFQKVILKGTFYQAVSEVAFGEMNQSYPTLMSSAQIEIEMNTALCGWAEELCHSGYSQLYKALTELYQSMAELLSHKERVVKSKKFKEIPTLMDQIREEECATMPDCYFKIAGFLDNEKKSWKKSLVNINCNIRKVQDLCVLMITQPNLPGYEIAKLQKEFKNLNRLLRDLIQPLTSFYNAFQYLLESNSHARHSSHPKEIAMSVSKKDSFLLKLFQTDQEYFRELDKQVSEIRSQNGTATIELEDAHVPASTRVEKLAQTIASTDLNNDESDLRNRDLLPPPISHILSSPQETAKDLEKPIVPKPQSIRDSVSGRVEEVFQSSTKSRKILHNLTQLLKEYEISFTKVRAGGSHFKIRLGDIAITLPDHKEWKPGTLTSIKNQALGPIIQAVKSRKESSKSA